MAPISPHQEQVKPLENELGIFGGVKDLVLGFNAQEAGINVRWIPLPQSSGRFPARGMREG